MYIQCIHYGRGGMIVEFCRWGNSLAVRIPRALAEALRVSDGKQAEIKVENGTLVLRPIVKPGRKPCYALDELLRGINCAVCRGSSEDRGHIQGQQRAGSTK